MLSASIANAQQDMDARMLAEQQVEADRVVESLNAALAADGEALLSPTERAELDAAIAHLLTMRNARAPPTRSKRPSRRRMLPVANCSPPDGCLHPQGADRTKRQQGVICQN